MKNSHKFRRASFLALSALFIAILLSTFSFVDSHTSITASTISSTIEEEDDDLDFQQPPYDLQLHYLSNSVADVRWRFNSSQHQQSQLSPFTSTLTTEEKFYLEFDPEEDPSSGNLTNIERNSAATRAPLSYRATVTSTSTWTTSNRTLTIRCW